MSYEIKNLSGALFKNDKEGNEHRPDYRGDCSINGVEYQIGAWLKTGKKGKFMTGKIGDEVEAREESRPQQRSQPQQTPPNDQFDDDIPF